MKLIEKFGQWVKDQSVVPSMNELVLRSQIPDDQLAQFLDLLKTNQHLLMDFGQKWVDRVSKELEAVIGDKIFTGPADIQEIMEKISKELVWVTPMDLYELMGILDKVYNREELFPLALLELNAQYGNLMSYSEELLQGAIESRISKLQTINPIIKPDAEASKIITNGY